MAKEKPFKLEADLCAAFIKTLPKGWTVYAETSGWDILLVRDVDGVQIGIEAKLKCNAQVLTQAIERGSYTADSTGPDHRAILVPAGESGYKAIADFIGVTIISVSLQRRWSGGGDNDYVMHPQFYPELPTEHYGHYNWHDCLPTKRHKLPDYVPDTTAGTPSPLTLTPWKISAIKLCILLGKRGFLVRTDFKHLHMDHRRWVAKDYGWLTVDDAAKVYRAGPKLPDLKAQHPRNWDEIEADYEKWAPRPPPLIPEQTAML